MTAPIRIVSSKVLSKFWGTLTGYEIEYTRVDGTTQRLSREAYDHGAAAAVLLYDETRDRVVLVKQFRFATHIVGGPDFMIEVVAGMLDGDTPETCAQREAKEEAGVTLIELRPAFAAFVSPGSITEKIDCFVGTYRGPVDNASGLGLHHEGEDIEVMELPFDEAFAMIGRGEIMDAKTILLLQHLALSRRSAI